MTQRKSIDSKASRSGGSEAPAARPKPSKLGAEKLTPEEQRRRFIEAAREAGCSEDEAEFDANLAKIVKPGSRSP